MVYLHARGVHYVLENPASSLLWRYRCLKARATYSIALTAGVDPFRNLWRPTGARRSQYTWVRMKLPLPNQSGAQLFLDLLQDILQVILVGTWPLLRELARQLTPHRREQIANIRRFLGIETCKTWTCKKTGKKKCV